MKKTLATLLVIAMLITVNYLVTNTESVSHIYFSLVNSVDTLDWTLVTGTYVITTRGNTRIYCSATCVARLKYNISITQPTFTFFMTIIGSVKITGIHTIDYIIVDTPGAVAVISIGGIEYDINLPDGGTGTTCEATVMTSSTGFVFAATYPTEGTCDYAGSVRFNYDMSRIKWMRPGFEAYNTAYIILPVGFGSSNIPENLLTNLPLGSPTTITIYDYLVSTTTGYTTVSLTQYSSTTVYTTIRVEQTITIVVYVIVTSTNTTTTTFTITTPVLPTPTLSIPPLPTPPDIVLIFRKPNINTPQGILLVGSVFIIFLYLVRRIKWTHALYCSTIYLISLSLMVFNSPELFTIAVVFSVLSLALDKYS